MAGINDTSEGRERLRNDDSAPQEPPAPPQQSTPASSQPPATRLYSEEEVQILRDQLAALQASQPAQSNMFSDPEVVEQARRRAKVLAEEKKHRVPEPVDGFSADPLRSHVPRKIDEAILKNKYIPITAVLARSRSSSSREEDDEMILTRDGTFRTRPLDRNGETNLPFQSWLAGINVLVERTRELLPTSKRANRLAAHIIHVSRIAESHSLEVAYRYDIKQREAAADVPQHDLGTFNADTLTLVSTAALSATAKAYQTAMAALGQPLPSSPSKRKVSLTSDSPSSPSKKLRAPAYIIEKQACFQWEQDSTCDLGDSCISAHQCSICDSSDHGANNCPQRFW
ncbi:hypothetical protein VNI00_010631 [Paramarasmius palmivorus]|uniref:C3H1-type domain-containing protein n=1 Tax=Paramarasmius palmivorus TaxID=297713 RepID=A0AAW0CJ50_9AGAR